MTEDKVNKRSNSVKSEENVTSWNINLFILDHMKTPIEASGCFFMQVRNNGSFKPKEVCSWTTSEQPLEPHEACYYLSKCG